MDVTCTDGKTLWDWFDYVAHQEAAAEKVCWGNRDTGHDRMRLADFLAVEQARKAKLRLEHVLALRLHTATPVSFALNNPLRNFQRDGETGADLEGVLTVSVLNEAIERLRDTKGKVVVTLWRGLKNMDLEEDSDFLLAGGVEMSCMSTSYDLHTALFYSHSPPQHTLQDRYAVVHGARRRSRLDFVLSRGAGVPLPALHPALPNRPHTEGQVADDQLHHRRSHSAPVTVRDRAHGFLLLVSLASLSPEYHQN